MRFRIEVGKVGEVTRTVAVSLTAAQVGASYSLAKQTIKQMF